MEIIYVTHYTGLYGANKSLLELITKMVKEYGIKPIVITPNKGELNAELDRLNIENYSFKYYYCKYLKQDNIIRRIYKYLRYKIFNQIALKKLIKKFKNDNISLIHTNSSCIDIGCKLANKLRIKHLWHIREFGEEDYGLINYTGNKRTYEYMENKSDVIIVISNILREKYLKFIQKKDKVKLIYNGVNKHDYFIDISNKNFDFEFNIVLAGLICEEKNQVDLIKCIDILVNKKDLNNIKVYLIGNGNEDYVNMLKKLVRTMKLEDNIKFEGRVENVTKYIQQSHIGIITSFKEAFGRVTVEYMLGGLAVVASNTGANPELIKENFDGIMYSLGDYQQLSEKIEYLYNNREKLKEICKNGQRKAINRFTSDINCKNIYNLYKDVLNGK